MVKMFARLRIARRYRKRRFIVSLHRNDYHQFRPGRRTTIIFVLTVVSLMSSSGSLALLRKSFRKVSLRQVARKAAGSLDDTRSLLARRHERPVEWQCLGHGHVSALVRGKCRRRFLSRSQRPLQKNFDIYTGYARRKGSGTSPGSLIADNHHHIDSQRLVIRK